MARGRTAKAKANEARGSTYYLSDRHINKVLPLVVPATLLNELPIDERCAEIVLRGRLSASSILNRVDDRLIVVVGPCSVHDTKAALEYAKLLSEQARELRADLCVIMRVYFEKPRTTTGWKGLINDPYLDDSGDVNHGLHTARKLLLEILQLELPIGCEFLDPITPQYIADAVSWGAIGARTTEGQIHRQLASGLSMPVGFKNRTDGNFAVAVDACLAGSASHTLTGISLEGTPAVLYTSGNPDCHVILRGGRDANGKTAPNYNKKVVSAVTSLLHEKGLPERVIIDASHDNSGKDHERQAVVAAEIASEVARGNHAIVGVMLESFLVAGRQELGPELVYGQSITDPCMAWDPTLEVLQELAAAVRERRKLAKKQESQQRVRSGARRRGKSSPSPQ